MNAKSNYPPFVVFDPDTKAEFVLPRLLRYYVAFVDGEWFICDRFSDKRVPNTAAKSRAQTIRLFYRQQDRQMPDEWTVPRAIAGTEHGGIG